MMKMRLLIPLLSFVGCTFPDITTPIPKGTGRIVAVVYDEKGSPAPGVLVEISLAELYFSDQREQPTDAQGRCVFEELGESLFSVRIKEVPAELSGRALPQPAGHSVKLGAQGDMQVRFDFHPAALLCGSVSVEGQTAQNQVGFAPLPIPESVWSMSLLDQRGWVADNLFSRGVASLPGTPPWMIAFEPYYAPPTPDVAPSPPRVDPPIRTFGSFVPASSEPYWIAVVGPAIVNWGMFLYQDCNLADQVEAQTGEEVWTEPLVFKKVGPVQPHRINAYGQILYPAWSQSGTPLIEGRFVDRRGNPVQAVMTLLPQGEGVGAFVLGREDGSYRILGLSSGHYRACVLRVDDEGIYQCQFDLEVPQSHATQDILADTHPEDHK